MSSRHPRQLLFTVKLVLHLEEGQSVGHKHDECQTESFTVTDSANSRPLLYGPQRISNGAAAAARVSLEDDVVDVGQRGPDAFQQQVQRLNGFRLLNQVITAGAQRQTEMELKQTHEHQDGNTTLTQ